MKIKCIKRSVDVNKILKGIDTFRMEYYGDNPSYIIMNYETRNDLLDFRYYDSLTRIYGSVNKREDRLFNIPVAINEGLEYGEVDIV